MEYSTWLEVSLDDPCCQMIINKKSYNNAHPCSTTMSSAIDEESAATIYTESGSTRSKRQITWRRCRRDSCLPHSASRLSQVDGHPPTRNRASRRSKRSRSRACCPHRVRRR